MRKIISITSILFIILLLSGCASNFIHYSGIDFEPGEITKGSIVNLDPKGYEFVTVAKQLDSIDQELEIDQKMTCKREDFGETLITNMHCSTPDNKVALSFTVWQTTENISTYNQLTETWDSDVITVHKITGAAVFDENDNKLSDQYSCRAAGFRNPDVACLKN